MSKRHKKSPVIVIERTLLNSKAYLALGGIAPQLLMLFYFKRRLEKVGKKGKERWICTNAAEIEFTYLEAKSKYGISNPRFTRGIDNLIANGFLDIVHQGGAYRHDKTIYALSNRWTKFGSPDFENFERQKETVQRGYCKPKH